MKYLNINIKIYFEKYYDISLIVVASASVVAGLTYDICRFIDIKVQHKWNIWNSPSFFAWSREIWITRRTANISVKSRTSHCGPCKELKLSYMYSCGTRPNSPPIAPLLYARLYFGLSRNAQQPVLLVPCATSEDWGKNVSNDSYYCPYIVAESLFIVRSKERWVGESRVYCTTN